MEQIRTPEGEKYQNSPRIVEEEKAKGYSVARVTEHGGIHRFTGPGTQDHPLTEQPTGNADQTLDQNARRTDIDGPRAGLGDLKVTKAPPVKQ